MTDSYSMTDQQALNIVRMKFNHGEGGTRDALIHRCFLNRKPYRDKHGEMRTRSACCADRKNCKEAGSML